METPDLFTVFVTNNLAKCNINYQSQKIKAYNYQLYCLNKKMIQSDMVNCYWY